MDRAKKIFLALSDKERISLGVAVILLIATASILLGIFVRESTIIVPSRGGEHIEGLVGQPSYINPLLAVSDVDKALVRLLFASANDLAEKIEADTNNRVWSLRLKEDLLWSDGKKLTTDDIIFTIQKIQERETQSPLFLSWQGVSFTRVSELEMQFNLVNPYPFFGENIKNLYPLPRHLFAQTPSTNWHLSEYNLKPIGSGPYAFQSYEKRSDGFIASYQLTTNTNYFSDLPFIERFIVSFFPDSTSLLDAFNRGTVDGLADFGGSLIEKVQRPYQVFSFALPSYYAFFFNQGQHLALKEKEVREALALAINRKDITNSVFGERASLVTDPLVSDSLSEKAQVAGEYSPERAIEILEKAGWKLNSEGVREKTIKNTSLKLELSLFAPDIPFLRKTAELVEQAWKKIGVKLTLNILPPSEIAERVVKTREYQIILFGNFLNPATDLYPFWHSDGRFFPGLNLALYSNKEADGLMDSIRRNPDVTSREKELTKLSEVIVNDYPAIFLYSPSYLYLANKELKGITPSFITDTVSRLDSVAKWYLKTARTLK